LAIKSAFSAQIDIEKLSEELHYIRLRIAMVTMEATELLRLAMKQKGLFSVERALFEQTNAIAIFCRDEDETAVSRALHTFKAMEIPLEYFSERQHELRRQDEQQLQRERLALADEVRKELQQIENRLYAMQSLEEARSSLQKVGDQLILEGWVPQKRAAAFIPDIEHAKTVFLEMEGACSAADTESTQAF